jgi:hypothetical protein
MASSRADRRADRHEGCGFLLHVFIGIWDTAVGQHGHICVVDGLKCLLIARAWRYWLVNSKDPLH